MRRRALSNLVCHAIGLFHDMAAGNMLEKVSHGEDPPLAAPPPGKAGEAAVDALMFPGRRYRMTITRGGNRDR